MYISNICNLTQLASLGYNLQCTERPVTMVFESYRKYSMYYILLFRDIESMYFGGNLLEFASEKTKISNEIVYVNGNEFKEYVKSNIEANKKMIIYSDLYWNNRYAAFYKSTHHIHPILLKAYDDANDKMLVIDENLDELRQSDKYYFWPYTEQNVDINFLEKVCAHWENEGQKKLYQICEFSAKNNQAVRLERILSDFKNMLSIINMEILGSEDTFLNKFTCSILEENTKVITERGRIYIYNHNKALNRLFRLFMCLLKDNPELCDELSELGNNIKNLYEKYYLSLVKNMKKSNQDIKIDRLHDIYMIEKRFYSFLENAVIEEESIITMLKRYAL